MAVCRLLVVGCCLLDVSDAVLLVLVALVGFDGDEVDGDVAELGWPTVFGASLIPPLELDDDVMALVVETLVVFDVAELGWLTVFGASLTPLPELDGVPEAAAGALEGDAAVSTMVPLLLNSDVGAEPGFELAVGLDPEVGVELAVVPGWVGETACAGAPWFAIEPDADEVPELAPERAGLNLLGAALAAVGAWGIDAALGCGGAAVAGG